MEKVGRGNAIANAANPVFWMKSLLSGENWVLYLSEDFMVVDGVSSLV
jgi:hypothetical protein